MDLKQKDGNGAERLRRLGRERMRRWRAKNPDRDKANKRTWRLANPGRDSEYEKKARAKSPEKYAARIADRWKDGGWRKGNLKRYGLTIEKYDEMLSNQGGVCGICGGTNKSGKALHVDHDHTTGFVRGLLCSKCNTFLGLADESIERLSNGILWLYHHRSAVEGG